MTQTIMEKEARQTPEVIRGQIQENQKIVTNIANKLHEFKPKMVMIIGRGSSEHAGVFAKYLIEIEAQIPIFAAAPSVSSVYIKQLDLDNALVIVISQSGCSPDILAQAKMAKKGGAYCITLVNDESSTLQDIIDDVLPLKAGKEESVAATKSYLSALLHLGSTWANNQDTKLVNCKMPIGLVCLATYIFYFTLFGDMQYVHGNKNYTLSIIN